MPTPVNPSQQEVIPKNIPMDYETKSGILLNPSAEKSKQIMDEARKKGQIK